MSSPQSQTEAAKKGDLLALATLIEQAFAPSEIQIETTKQWGIVPWFKLKSNNTLDAQVSLSVVLKVLNSVKPENINAARVSQVSPKDPKQQAWDETLELKNGNFVVTRITQTQGVFILAGIVASLFLFTHCAIQLNSIGGSSITARTTSPSSKTANTKSSERLFLYETKEGWEIWSEGTCLIVKGVTKNDLARFNADLGQFKKSVKQETGWSCVLLD